MSRVYNFSPGPAQLPEAVLSEVQEELLNWHQTGMSVMEIPHRGPDFKALAEESEQDLRDLLSIPEDYEVLFLHGGGRSQFAMVPMNIAAGYPCMAYVESGNWAKFAVQEAKIYGDVRVVASGVDSNYTELPDESEWDIPSDAAYLHYTDNETIQGLEFPSIPDSKGLALVSDMSSNLLSKPLDIRRYGIIYACGQKNIGPAGVTLVIIRKDLLEREPFAYTPSMYRYTLHKKHGSMYNTPATFPWYVSGLVLKWIKKNGGVAAMASNAQVKSKLLYDSIDRHDFYENPVKSSFRSRMNVVFRLADESLEQIFLQAAAENSLINLKGHRSVGGMRASIYNGMPLKGVAALADFMDDFAKRYG